MTEKVALGAIRLTDLSKLLVVYDVTSRYISSLLA